jgi:hypothetical protein
MSKHAGGRPLKFSSVELLQKQINSYFRSCKPRWIQEAYYDYPLVDVTEELEPQPNGGALKRRYKRDTTQAMTRQKRWVLSDPDPPMITGLALALNTTRETLLDYEKGNRDLTEEDDEYDPDVPKFSDTIKEAKLRCEHWAAVQLHKGKNPAGSIFNLKNNYNWKDTAEVTQDQNITVITRGSGSHTPVAATLTEEDEDGDD